MAKALKAVGTAIVIVGAVVATGGAALAFGAGATLGGAIGLASSTVLSVGGFSVSAGALLGVGSLVSSVGGALSQPKVSTAGNALGWVGDPNGPMHFAAGRIAVGGDLRHKKAYGPNDRMYFSAVTVVSDAGPITAFESFTANDVPVTFDGSGKANSSHYANVMWRRTQLGNQPEPSYLASPSGLEGGATLPNWGASHKLSGKAAFILTLSENSKQSAYKGQQPKPRHVIRGLKVYDWRQDSTYPGGSGPQRLNEPTTWTYSANPALWAAKWEFGLWEGPDHGGAPQLDTQVGGIGVRPSNLDFAAYTELANICDTHGWTVAAWPSTDDDKVQVLDAFLQAAGAYYIQRGGKESCIHRAAPRVSVATISAADTAGPIELDTGASFTQRKNCGVPTYLSEADGWKMTALGQVAAPEWIEEDGGRERSAPVTYSYVSKAKQAAELMCLAIAHTREGIRGRIPLKPYMQGIQPGSAFTITEPEFVLNGLKCLCLETNYDAMTGVHTVTFVSESDGKYAFAFGQAPNPPAPPALEAVDPTYVTPPLPGDWTIVPRPPSSGGQLPGFDLSGQVSNDTATSIHVEWWEVPANVDPNDPPPEEDQFWQSAGVWPPTATTIPIDVQPDRYYWIGLSYVRNQNYSARTLIGPWLAGQLIADDVSAIRGEPVDQVLGRLADAEALAATTEGRVDALEVVVEDAQGDFNQALILAEQYADASEAGAVASDARATDAENAAGQALTYAGQASEALDDTITARIGAETAATNADAAAATVLAQASQVSEDAASASASASAASISANLAASVGASPNLLQNGGFEQGFAGWTNTPNLGGSLYRENMWGPQAAYAGAGLTSIEWISTPFLTVYEGATYTFSFDPLIFGTAGVAYGYPDVVGLNAADAIVWSPGGISAGIVANRDFSNAPNSRVAASVTIPSGLGIAKVYFRWIAVPAGGGTITAFGIRRAKVDFGATATGYSSEATEQAVSAQLSITAAVAADAATRLSTVRFDVTGGAGGAPFQIWARADGSGSAAGLIATEISLSNVVGGAVVTALKLINGEAYFGAPVSVTVASRRLTIGPGFGVSSQCVLWFGPDATAIGSMTLTNGYFALGTDGKVYLGTAELGNSSPKTTSTDFSGNAGVSGGAAVPLNTAGTTPPMTVPGSGKIVVDVSNVFALSEGNGSNNLSLGSLILQIGKNGSYTSVASGITTSTSETVAPGRAQDVRAMNVTVTHAFAGPVTFRVLAQGAGPTTHSRSVVTGVLKATWFPD